MGSVGRQRDSVSFSPVSAPSTDRNDYKHFNDSADYREWLKDPNNSNFSDLQYTDSERNAIYIYTGNAYKTINRALYDKEWKDISASTRMTIQNMDSGLSKFDLKNGIEITRQCDFQVFGAKDTDNMSLQQVKDYLAPSKGVLQNDGFMSFSMDDEGRSIAGSGVVIHLRIPPTTGAGAPVYNISQHSSEREFLLGRNAILHFDESTVRQEGSKIHVTAYYLGRAEKGTRG